MPEKKNAKRKPQVRDLKPKRDAKGGYHAPVRVQGGGRSVQSGGRATQ